MLGHADNLDSAMSKMLHKTGQRQTGPMNGWLTDNPRQAPSIADHYQRCFSANRLEKISYGNGHKLNLVVQFLLKISKFGAMFDALMIHRLVPRAPQLTI